MHKNKKQNMAVSSWITFASRGIAAAPIRAQLVEEASQHLDKAMVTYVLIDLDGSVHGTNGNDVRDYEFKGRSRAEAAVALLDYLNECRPSPQGYDNYTGVVDDEADFDNDWRMFFMPNDNMWLMELREIREARTVPELPIPLKTKPARC